MTDKTNANLFGDSFSVESNDKVVNKNFLPFRDDEFRDLIIESVDGMRDEDPMNESL